MGLFDWLKKDNKNTDNVTDVIENIQGTESEAVAAFDEEEFEDDAYTDKQDVTTAISDTENELLESDDTITEEESVVEAIIDVEENAEDTENLSDAFDKNDSDNIISTDNKGDDIIDIALSEEEQTDLGLNKAEEPKGLFAKIKAGLSKTRENIMSGVESVLKSFTSIDDEFYEELEEALIMADVGVETSTHIISLLKDKVKKDKIKEVADVKSALIEVIADILNKEENEFKLSSPSVLLIIGVNGVGKTTTIGKLTHIYKNQGNNVLLAAADTFRAAAIDQLEVWADRSDVKLIKHEEGSDPGAVVFDAVQAAKSRRADILICDTAGRLHNKKNLMDELKKISKIIGREYSEAQVETLLVLDATTGQNALQQAKLFNEVADITGIVLTKLDGTAKGGVVIAISNELDIPVRFIGVGEGMDDLQLFDSKAFAKALFDSEQ